MTAPIVDPPACTIGPYPAHAMQPIGATGGWYCPTHDGAIPNAQ